MRLRGVALDGYLDGGQGFCLAVLERQGSSLQL